MKSVGMNFPTPLTHQEALLWTGLYPKEFEQIRLLIKHNPNFNRTRLSTEVCRMFQWLKPDGKLKDMSCRVAMLRMEKDGLIQLPPSTRKKQLVKKIEFMSATDPQHPISSPVNQLPQLHLQLVTKATLAVQKDRFAGTCYKAANWVKE